MYIARPWSVLSVGDAFDAGWDALASADAHRLEPAARSAHAFVSKDFKVTGPE
jgi:hypothetical protein